MRTYKFLVPKKNTHILLLGILFKAAGGSTINAGQYGQYFILALIIQVC